MSHLETYKTMIHPKHGPQYEEARYMEMLAVDEANCKALELAIERIKTQQAIIYWQGVELTATLDRIKREINGLLLQG